MSFDPPSLKALFQAALDLTDPAAQAAYLAEACHDDSMLHDKVFALLEAHARADRFLASEQGPPDLALADFALDETAAIPSGATIGFSEQAARRQVRPPVAIPSPVGTTIAGRYKIRQKIGEGGMGSVYLADQFQPIKRQVALKLIRAGMDSRTVLVRFESERQALAMMDHPHIARVLDAGTTESGHPFFVMDLVKGIPLTDYCDNHRLSLPARLQLFQQICAAVQHAHQKGIIHRDLKPTNILVEDHDGRPVPKVIDFGLAKATTDLQLTDQSLFTAFGSITGTPLYMAPEQATFNALDVDTRADIYTLGVILYELLTGSTPIRKESLHKSAFDDMLRVIREEEPPTPSHRISTSESLPGLAANRHVEPSRLGRFVRGDLDWIVMKALAKERVRRYDSAISLANDVERFLHNEPVTAGPPTARYRTAKFLRRHRGQAVAASLVFLVLVGGVIGTTLGLFEAKRQEQTAKKQEMKAKRQEILAIEALSQQSKARQAEVEQRAWSELRLTQVTQLNKILSSIFKDINPHKAEKNGKPLAALLGDRLVQAAAQIEGESIGDPVTVARMQLILSQSLMGLGYPGQAIDLLTRCRATLEAELGGDHPDTLTVIDTLANAYRDAGERDQMLPLLKRTLAIRTAKLGPDHPDTLTNQGTLAEAYRACGQSDQILPLLKPLLRSRIAKLGPDHPDTMASMHNLGVAYNEVGQVDLAIPLIEQALAARWINLGPDHPDTMANLGTLAVAYSATGHPNQMIPGFDQTLATRQAKLGPDHPDLLAAGPKDRTVPLLEQALDLMRKKLSPDHPDILYSMGCLATAYRFTGRRDEVVPLLAHSLEARSQNLGPDHPDTLTNMDDLAAAYYGAGRLDLAIPLFEKTLKAKTLKLGLDHPDTLTTMGTLGVIYRTHGPLNLAIPMLKKTLEAKQERLGADHPESLATKGSLAVAYGLDGQSDLAISLFKETLTSRMSKQGLDHPDTLRSMHKLALAYKEAEQADLIGPIYDDILSGLKRKLRPNDPVMIRCLKEIARSMESCDLYDRAEPIWDTIVTERRESCGAFHPETFAAQLDRADLDLHRQRLDLAETAYRTIGTECRSKLSLDHINTIRAEQSLADLLKRKAATSESN